jgi:hypothetical protein
MGNRKLSEEKEGERRKQVGRPICGGITDGRVMNLTSVIVFALGANY